MKRISPGQTLAFVANLGVLLGLVVLVVEIRLANRIATTATEIEVRNNFAAISETFYTDEAVAALMVKSMDADAEFTPVERMKAASVVRRFNNAWLSVETAYDNGLVPAVTYATIENDIISVVQQFPALRPIWRAVVDSYPAQETTKIYRTIDRALAQAK